VECNAVGGGGGWVAGAAPAIPAPDREERDEQCRDSQCRRWRVPKASTGSGIDGEAWEGFHDSRGTRMPRGMRRMHGNALIGQTRPDKASRGDSFASHQ
jgi:hypothetical protein